MRAQGGTGTASVLFTDLVGSTELLASLGDLRYDEVRREHFAVLRQAITANDGNEIKTTGDGLMATFTSAVHTVACAVAMQQSVDQQRQTGAGPLEMRVGMAIGEVTFEADDVHGTPVVEAARLVGRARGGQILATSLLRAMVGGRTEVRFVDVGPLELKGLPEPVPTCEVIWERRTATIPLPLLLDRRCEWTFVGRDHLLGALRELWQEAAGGQRTAVLIRGEPGAGKTRLAVELARVAHAGGALVLAGRCEEEIGAPYQPFAEALRHFVDHGGTSDSLVRRLGRYGGDLIRLVPEIAGRVSRLPAPLHSDPDSERLRLFEAVASWLGAAGGDGAPVLLVLDDMHWAAKPTFLLLRHLLATTESEALLVVVTYRDSDLFPGHPLSELLADLHRVPRVERFALPGLDEEGVRRFLAADAGRELEAGEVALCRAVHAETSGNPFFVGEVVRHLRELGAGGSAASGLTRGELGIPAGVREVVGQRLRRLSDPACRMLRAAAVLGVEFEVEVLAGMLVTDGFDEEHLLATLEEADAALLLGEVPARSATYRFTQGIVRGALYDQLSDARRRVLHSRAGVAIEMAHGPDLDAYLPALVHHFDSAGPARDSGRVTHYCGRAGDQALAQLAFEPAVAFYDKALAGIDGPDAERDAGRRRHLLLSRARARAGSGDQGALEDYLAAADLARDQRDGDALGHAALGLADVWVASWHHSHEVQIGLLEEALAAQGDARSTLRARLAARLAGELAWRPRSLPRRRALAEESVAVARGLDDPATLAACLDHTTFAVWIPGDSSRRRAAGEEIVALAADAGDPELALKGHAWCHIAGLEESDPAALDAALDAYETCAGEVRQARYQWYALTRRTMRAILAGDLDRGEALAREALAAGRAQGEGDADSLYGCQMSLVWQERPSSDAAGHLGTMRHHFATTPPRAELQAVTRSHSIALAVGAGDPAEIRKEFDALLETNLPGLEPSLAWTSTFAGAATAAAHVGTDDEAGLLYELMVPAADLNAFCFGAVSYWGSLRHHLGVLATRLGRFDEAEGHLAAAEAVHRRLGARIWLTRTHLEWAVLLGARGRPADRDRSRALVDGVLATVAELRLPAIGHRARSLLGDR